jgi:hypothetical protein
MPVATTEKSLDGIYVSPLQMALAAATLSNNGKLPPARIALAANTLQEGWVILPTLGESIETLPSPFARETALALAGDNPYWSFTSVSEDTPVTWYLAGTLPDWNGTPLALVILLEDHNRILAEVIAQKVLGEALQP